MSDRPVSSISLGNHRVSVYLHDDRVEVGRMDMSYREQLSRVAYRDVRRVVAWTAQRTVLLVLGALLAGGWLLGAVVLFDASAGNAGTALLPVILSLPIVLFGALLIWRGRPHGITRFRVEGVRGTVEGVLGGTRRKRASVLADLDRRIATRQS